MPFDWSASTVLISGGTGTFGRAAAHHLLSERKVKKLRILSRGEERQRQMAVEFAAYPNISFIIGDVRDVDRLRLAFRGVDVVLHAAALKQIPVVEYNCFEAIHTNVIGTENVLRAAMDCGVGRILTISSDKSPSPANLYGATKMCAEKLTQASNAYTASIKPRPIFAVVRYGNVAGSTGSVVDVFRKQFAETGRVQLTAEGMTRFWWAASQAVSWTASVVEVMEAGCLYVPLLPSVRIVDIAKAIAGDKIDVVGMRPGEKCHEVMLTEEEMAKAECGAGMYVVRPNAVEQGPRIAYCSRDNDRWLTGKEAIALADSR